MRAAVAQDVTNKPTLSVCRCGLTRVGVVGALVGARHGVCRAAGHHVVRQPRLSHVGRAVLDAAEMQCITREANAARVGADARGELLEVVDGVEHVAAARNSGRESANRACIFGAAPSSVLECLIASESEDRTTQLRLKVSSLVSTCGVHVYEPGMRAGGRGPHSKLPPAALPTSLLFGTSPNASSDEPWILFASE